MSRSYHHTPITGITKCESEKQDKREANRKLRRKTNQATKSLLPHDLFYFPVGYYTLVFPLLREVSNVWSFGKDGKVYRPEMLHHYSTKRK